MILLAFALPSVGSATDARAAASVIAQPAPQRPILILISIDGWRWDYLDRFKPPAIAGLAASGVRSEGLIPSFPTKTFPNHYTIVTGLYPHRHGIVLNNILDPALPGVFSLSSPTGRDTRWWGGVPLWVSAEQQGQIAATMFWPGSDVEIAGDRPTYWRPYEHTAPNGERIDQLLAWLRRPEAERPTFLTLYFSDVDSAGHDDGPDAPAMGDAVRQIDGMIARLVAGIEAAGLATRTNYLLVSDHGMAPLSSERRIILDDYLDPSTLVVQDWSPILVAGPRPPTVSGPARSVDDIYWALKDKHPNLAVYKLSELPERYRLRDHPRLLPIIGIADDGWDVTSLARLKRRQSDDGSAGTHGYDPIHQSMHGLFVASGPAFRSGVVAPRFENVHLYELMCRVLRLRPAPNDGDPNVTAAFFK